MGDYRWWIIFPIFSWSCPSRLLLETSNQRRSMERYDGKWNWPTKELLWRFNSCSLVWFSSNQMGKLPFNILWEISTTSNSCWSKKNLGMFLVSLFILQLDSIRTFNWNKGCQLGLSVSISSLLLLLGNWITFSLEWLANKLNENKPSKEFSLRSMCSRDVMLDIEDEVTFPLNKFPDISNNLRDVKLFRHEGRVPSKSLEARSNSSNPHKSVKEQ